MCKCIAKFLRYYAVGAGTFCIGVASLVALFQVNDIHSQYESFKGSANDFENSANRFETAVKRLEESIKKYDSKYVAIDFPRNQKLLWDKYNITFPEKEINVIAAASESKRERMIFNKIKKSIINPSFFDDDEPMENGMVLEDRGHTDER